MSLAIDVDKVSAVLLADGWHDVQDGSFTLDAYEYRHGDERIHGGGEEDFVPATGFEFKSGSMLYCGPLTSILAVRMRAKK